MSRDNPGGSGRWAIIRGVREPRDSIETPYGWVVIFASLLLMSLGAGGYYVSVVGLKLIASEWGGDPSTYLVRRAQFELDGGNDDAARGYLEAAIERSPHQPEAIRKVLAAPGVVRALGNAATDKLRTRLAETEVPPQPDSDEAEAG